MVLCSLCANIKYDDLFAGSYIPWGGTVSDLRASAPTCELCALFVSAWQDNPSLRILPDNQLWLAGICNSASQHTDGLEPRRITSARLYVDVDDAARLAGGEDAGKKMGSPTGVSVFKAESAILRVMCGMFTSHCLVFACNSPAASISTLIRC